MELSEALVAGFITLAGIVPKFVFVPNGTRVDNFAVDIFIDGRI